MSVINCTKDNFESEVLKSKGKVLVDFNATWCGPCRMVGPIVEELSEEAKDVKFLSADIDENEELSKEYDVFSIPCLVLFKDGVEVDRKVGFVNKEELEEFIGVE